MKDLLVDLRVILVLIFFSLLLSLFDSLGFLKFPKTLLQTVTVPIQYGIYKSGLNLGKQVEFIFLVRRASLENKALKSQLGELMTQNADLQKQLRETQSLVDAYNKLSPQTYDLLPARVISSSRYLTLDKGENDGIKLGEVVVYKDNYLGQIKSISSKTSQILLMEDPDSKIAAFSQGDGTHAKGILEGQFGSESLMDKILHQEKVNVGDLVYSEGSEGLLPRGLILGKVTQVFERQNEVFQQAKVEPLFKPEELGVVFIIRTQ